MERLALFLRQRRARSGAGFDAVAARHEAAPRLASLVPLWVKSGSGDQVRSTPLHPPQADSRGTHPERHVRYLLDFLPRLLRTPPVKECHVWTSGNRGGAMTIGVAGTCCQAPGAGQSFPCRRERRLFSVRRPARKRAPAYGRPALRAERRGRVHQISSTPAIATRFGQTQMPARRLRSRPPHRQKSRPPARPCAAH